MRKRQVTIDLCFCKHGLGEIDESGQNFNISVYSMDTNKRVRYPYNINISDKSKFRKNYIINLNHLRNQSEEAKLVLNISSKNEQDCGIKRFEEKE